MATIRLSSELIRGAMQSDVVRARLAALADRGAARSRTIAEQEGVDVTITRSSGTRPGGRPYERITSDNPDAEWGTSKTRRSRILARGATTG